MLISLDNHPIRPLRSGGGGKPAHTDEHGPRLEKRPAVGQTYSARFQTPEVQGLLKVVESATVMTADSAALLVRRYENFIVKPATGQGVYVWSDSAGALVVVNEVS